MIPDKIGTIGKIHGVKPSRIPPPKKVTTISQKLPERSSVATSALSDFGAARRLGAALVCAGPSAAIVAAAGCTGISCAAAGRVLPGFQAANVRSKVLL